MSDHKNYLFVHFRETTSPEGEQVYFALSRDGFHWEALNDGRPILWAYYGDYGVRDMTIFRDPKTGIFHISATDLSLSYGMRGKYNHSWDNIREHGSKHLAHWLSEPMQQACLIRITFSLFDVYVSKRVIIGAKLARTSDLANRLY